MAISLCVQGKSYCVFLEEGLPQKVSNHFTEVKKFYAGECYKGICYIMLVVQQLGFGAFTSVAWVQSLVGELRSHKPCGTAPPPPPKKNQQEKEKEKEEDNEFSFGYIQCGTTLVVQWLRLCSSTGAQVRSLVGELRSCMPRALPKKKPQTFRGVHLWSIQVNV